MRVLVLSWHAGGDGASLRPQVEGLVRALAGAGHEIRLVTRRTPSGVGVDVGDVEAHVVADAPPIVPADMADPVLDALAFANRATSVAVRRLEEAAVDVVHAEGWQTGPVVAALRHSHGVPVVAAIEPWELAAQHVATAEVAAAVADAADVRVQRALGSLRAGVLHLPPGVTSPARRPGPPPASGPLVLVAPPGVAHRELAGRLRAALATPRRISRSWRRRPFAVAVLDPHDLDAVVRALALGVPVVAVPGPAGDLVAASQAGEVLGADVAARRAAGRLAADVADAIDRLVGDRGRAVALGAAASAAAAGHEWSVVVDAWAGAALRAVRRGGRPRLHAAD